MLIRWALPRHSRVLLTDIKKILALRSYGLCHMYDVPELNIKLSYQIQVVYSQFTRCILSTKMWQELPLLIVHNENEDVKHLPEVLIKWPPEASSNLNHSVILGIWEGIWERTAHRANPHHLRCMVVIHSCSVPSLSRYVVVGALHTCSDMFLSWRLGLENILVTSNWPCVN